VDGYGHYVPLIRQAKSVVGLSAEGKHSGFHALLQSGVFFVLLVIWKLSEVSSCQVVVVGIVDLVFGDLMLALSSQGKQPCGGRFGLCPWAPLPHTHSHQF